jgi:hypothetical protein
MLPVKGRLDNPFVVVYVGASSLLIMRAVEFEPSWFVVLKACGIAGARTRRRFKIFLASS